MWKKILQYAAVTVGIILCCFGSLYYMRPFGYGLYLAALTLMHPIALTVAIIGGELAAAPNTATVIELATTVAAVAVAYFCMRKRKKRLWPYLAAAAVGKLGCIYRVVIGESLPLTEILAFGFTALTAIVAQAAFRPLVVDKLKYRLTETEAAALAGIGVIGGLSLSTLTFFGFDPGITLAVAAIGFLAALGSPAAAFAAAVSIGGGIALHTFDVAVMAALCAAAALGVLFSAAPRPLVSAAVALGFTMVTYLFGSISTAETLAVAAAAVGAVLPLVLPPRWVRKIKCLLGEGRRPALRYMINRERSDVGCKLAETGRIFGDMAGVMNCDCSTEPTNLGKTLRARVCADCRERGVCAVSDATCDELMRAAVQNGHVGVSSLPQSLSDGCRHLAAVVKESGRLLDEQTQLNERQRRETEMKRAVAEQLFALRDILSDMGRREAQPVGMHPELERKLVEELTYRDIVCGEALIADYGNRLNVTLVVRLDCIDRAAIERTVGKTLGRRVTVVAVSDSNMSGWGIVSVETGPRLDALFAVASVPKAGSGISGDTHSFVKIGSRFMMALSDGMGSGERAHVLSENAVTLVESFYKAGYSNELILQSVNRFLSCSADGFSAVDIAVIDLDEGKSDLIKIGAPASYIKNDDTVTVVRGEALPLGIVEEMRPFIVSRKLCPGEVAVLVSDGVSDCFEGDGLADVINKLSPYNPQTLATEVLSTALARSGGKARDDMTVLCARIFEPV